MKAAGTLFRQAVPTVLVLLIVSFAPPQPADAAPTLHALLVILDADAELSDQTRINKERMEDFLNNVEATLAYKKVDCKVNIDHLLSSAHHSEKKVTDANIFKWLQNVNPGADDVVFVYYSGHGKIDRRKANTLVLMLPDKNLSRHELAKAIERLQCRLKILITDSCSSGTRVTEQMNLETKQNNFDVDKIIKDSPDIGESFIDLFLEHEGFLNLTSTSDGEFAFGDNREGGWFTLAFVKVLYRFRNLDQSPQDGFVSWEEVFKATRLKTMLLFERYVKGRGYELPDRVKRQIPQTGQTTQRPKYFGELPKPNYGKRNK